MAQPAITASLLYDLVQCPKRVELDLFEEPGRRDPISPFLQLLWERGALHEIQVVERMSPPPLILSGLEGSERELRTLEAMQRGEPLIFGGRIAADDLLGIPDLLRREGAGYIPVDIKSGRGEESGGEDSDGKPKLHYAAQLALYVDILERLNLSSGRRGAIIDVEGQEVSYDLMQPRGPKSTETLWDEYSELLAEARSIAARSVTPLAAAVSACKLCHWYTLCFSALRAADDLTLIPGLGRSIRDAVAPALATVSELARCNSDAYIVKNKTTFSGLGPDRLKKFQARAKLLAEPDAKPYISAPIKLPVSDVELFFDIEVDPFRNFTYLHGILERRGGDTASERFVAYFAENETPDAERTTFAASLAQLTKEPRATIWYYSKYERTIYRQLQRRYPDVCSAEDIEQLFDPSRAIDLYYDVVAKATEWPTNDHSIKTLAKYLGFSWRDTDPSGAASIEWFDRWVRERDPQVKARILAYNEDDCRATRVLLDGLRALGA